MMTMLSSESLVEKWNLMGQHSSGYVRIDAEHSLEWHIGYEGINQRSLLLITSIEPSSVASSKSILVSYAQRADSDWALTFRLLRMEQEEVYIRLCCDLIESSRNQTDTIEGLEFVLNRYSQWTRLMELQRNGLLSEAERKGLMGEICFLQQIMSQGAFPFNAVTSWIGPEGADQDFVDEHGWHEIKAPGIGAKTVSISSLEQLEATLPGELVLFFIDKTAPNDAKSFTLSSIVADMREMLRGTPIAFDLFNLKLLQYGYIDMQEYEKQWYRLGGVRRYNVDEDFPRLLQGNVPVQITAASYQINIQSIENWKVD
ncbi:PD-(D/E)XK motif protein [Paenibacillus sp. TAF43_2]|uniref:PD-(D/E)XK motif protein n=1 Tax=Paenibacillus sp. TAF43_2 TaxID=3233069 RepID=UPI003F9BD8A6